VRVEVEPNEPVESLKDKLAQELGGDVPEEFLNTLSYVGVPLENERDLSSYKLRESSLLYLGRTPYYSLPNSASGSLSHASNSNINGGNTLSGSQQAAQSQQQQQPAGSQPTTGPYEVVWN
jgi:hypothetical protein